MSTGTCGTVAAVVGGTVAVGAAVDGVVRAVDDGAGADVGCAAAQPAAISTIALARPRAPLRSTPA